MRLYLRIVAPRALVYIVNYIQRAVHKEYENNFAAQHASLDSLGAFRTQYDQKSLSFVNSEIPLPIA